MRRGKVVVAKGDVFDERLVSIALVWLNLYRVVPIVISVLIDRTQADKCFLSHSLSR